MDETTCANSYTYLLSKKNLCLNYIQANKSLCKDQAIRYEYGEACNQKTLPHSSNINFESLATFGLFLCFSIAAYFIYLFFRNFFPARKEIHSIEISFPAIIKEDEIIYIEKLKTFFSSIHDLLRHDSLSFEMYKVDTKITFQITSQSISTLETIKSYLPNITGIRFKECDDLLSGISYAKASKVFLKSNLYVINPDEKNFFANIINYFASLESSENAGILFCMRAITRKDHLTKKLQTLEESFESKNVNLKRDGNIFLTQIYTIGSSRKIISALRSIFNSTSSFNRFKETNLHALWKLKARYVRKMDIFYSFFHAMYGSFLNAQELANLIHPIPLDRGIYTKEESQVLEASPTFLEKREDNVLIGTSTLKNGKKTNVYLPLENLARHIYLVGKTGMGKSTLLIQLFLSLNEKFKDKALIMLDPHGEDLLKILRKIKNWDDIVYFNLSESTKTFTFNPLFSFQETVKQKDTRLEEIMTILEEESLKKNKDLGTSIEKLLSFLVATAIHFPDAYFQFLTKEKGLEDDKAKAIIYDRQITFPDLAQLLRKNSGFPPLFKKIFKNYNEDIGYRWTNNVDEYLINQAILDGVENRLKYLLKDSIIPLFEGNKFNIVDLVKDHKRLLMPLTIQSFGKSSRKIISKFILAELWFYAQSITNEADREEVILFIDEFQNTQLEIIDQILSEARKYKIRLIFGNQYFGQLWDQVRSSVMGNVSTIFAFNIGNLEEAKLIPPLFKNKVTPESIASLPPYHAYLRTLNPLSNQETAFLSYETIDTAETISDFHTSEEIQLLNEKCLVKYGEEVEVLKQRHMDKQRNPERYFLKELYVNIFS